MSFDTQAARALECQPSNASALWLAMADACDEVDSLRAALAFYADPDGYWPDAGRAIFSTGAIQSCPIDLDRGERARVALGEQS